MKQTILDKNELEYFFVEESYGGNQDLFPDVTMRDGGCGAIAACESCIYFARTNGIKNLYPHQSQEISWKEYHDFAYETLSLSETEWNRYAGTFYGRVW